MRHEDAVNNVRSVYQKEKHMKQVKEDIRYLIWFVLIIATMLLASGCGKKTQFGTQP
jgi:ABC-type phosphate transport system ATPase subunit